MALGRKTGGRKKGTPNKLQRPRKIAQHTLVDVLSTDGITPLEYMLAVLRDPHAKALEKSWAAEKAAPYMHPRIAPIDKDTGQTSTQTVIVQWLGSKQPVIKS